MEQLLTFNIDGAIYADISFIGLYFGVQKRTVKSWDMPFDGKKKGNTKLYNLIDVSDWKKANVKEAKTTKTVGRVMAENEENPYTDLPDHAVPKEELERRHEYEKLKKAKMQNDVLEEKYIEFDEVDKLMATLSVMLLSSLKNHEKSAPAELENKSSSEILERLKSAHYDIADRLHELANKEFDCDETLYDIIYAVLDKMHKSKKITPKQIIKLINAK